MRSILTGLTLSYQDDYNHIILETDSMEAVNLIQQPGPTFHPCLNVRNQCTKLLLSIEDCQVRHVYREANQAAHMMVSLGKSVTPGHHVCYDPPAQLCNILLKDVDVPLYSVM